MRFTVSSTVLNSRLNALAKVISSKNSMPILNSFLFSIGEGQLTLTASDNENTITSQILLDGYDGEGRFCIENHTILDAMKELAEQPITFDIDPDSFKTSIQYQNGEYNIVALPADEYPAPAVLGDANTTVTMPSQLLSENITRSLFATAHDEIRPVMNGLYFDLTGECLTVVATDGRKLVRNKLLTVSTEEPTSFILPKKPATVLKNLLLKDDSDVVISFDGRTAQVSFADGTLICRLVEGRYPNYNSVIPRNNNNCATIDRKLFLGILKRVLPFASDASQLVRIHVDSGRIVISSEDIDFSTSAKEEAVCTYDGMPMDIGFKGSTLMEVLNNLESEQVMLRLADAARAGLIVPAEQPEGQEIVMLLMPMLLND